jgi:hypothetical protein
MPSTAEPDQTRHPAWLVLSQECDASTLRAELLSVMRGESCDPELRVVVDFRRTSFLPEAGEALAIADLLAPPTRFLEPRVALVAADEEALRVLGMIATLATLRGGVVRSFRSFDAALAWLDEAVADGDPPRPSISAR